MTVMIPDDMPIYLSAKLMEASGVLHHWCPGCKQMHMIHVRFANHRGAIWGYNENPESPTFTPSINCIGLCHYFITAGQIIYCSDCKHALAGQTVALPDIPKDELW